MKDIIKTNSNKEFIKTICEIIKEEANKNIKEKNSFTFVLSGGRTPKDIFIELALNYKESIEWSKVHFFWLDERCVEPTNENSNYKLAYDYLISKLDKVGSVHRMKGELNPEVATKEYKEKILNFFGADEVRFDFVLLGMGEDGHVASLFPNSVEFKKVSDLVLATEKSYGGYRRVTLGLNLINMSRYKLLMVSGGEKLELLKGFKTEPITLIEKINIVGVA